MLAKLAKADGVISKEELRAVETYMTQTLQLRGTNRMLAIKIFRKAKDSAERFEEFAEQYGALFEGDRKTLERTVDLLLAIASAEPRGTERKYALIRKAVKLFGLDSAQYERLNGARLKGASKRASFHCADPYLVLGCKAGDSLDILRRAYRRLARKYHPDTITAQGLPPEFKRFAERKFREIQSAYDQLSNAGSIGD
jgi:DnaJ like chaperone protein